MTPQQVKNLNLAARDPVWLVENVFKPKQVWEYQKEVLRDLATWDRVAWRSGHGCGKTTTAAWAAIWFLFTFPNSKVITTASAWRQVEKQLWPEIRRWLSIADMSLIGDPKFETLNLMIKIDDAWFATGEASDDPLKMEGFHAPYLLYIVDEGKAVPPPTYEAIDGALTQGGKILVISTPPAEKAGYFYDIFSRKVPGYHLHHTSSEDSPNVSKAWIESRKEEWGEDSPIYITRVKGEFAESGENHLIPLSKIELAVSAEGLSSEKKLAALDVARFGEDKTVLAIREGNEVTKLFKWEKQDTMETVGVVGNKLRELGINEIIVDVIGVGAGVADRLREIGFDVYEFNSAEKADDSEKHSNKRAEMWDGLRARFIDKSISIPDDSELIGQLSNVKYKYDSRGRLVIESKDDIKKRGLKSPDKGDAVAMVFYPTEFIRGRISLDVF